MRQKKSEENDIWTKASKEYAIRKAKDLVRDWQQEQKSKGEPWRREDLAEKLHCHRNTLDHWLNGKTPLDVQLFCEWFKVNPSFFVAKNLDELDIVDETHHKMMQSNSAELASQYGVSKTFLWYLKSDQQIQDEILNHQPTDAILNSFDPNVPDVGSPYQFVNSNGEKAYLNEYTMPLLGEIEPKVKEYIRFLLWSEYNKRRK